jgi:hypothetical protein
LCPSGDPYRPLFRKHPKEYNSRDAASTSVNESKTPKNETKGRRCGMHRSPVAETDVPIPRKGEAEKVDAGVDQARGAHQPLGGVVESLQR